MDEGSNRVGVAYDEVFSALHDGVLRYAYLLVGDRDVAHDLAAEAFARMLVPWHLSLANDARVALGLSSSAANADWGCCPRPRPR